MSFPAKKKLELLFVNYKNVESLLLEIKKIGNKVNEIAYNINIAKKTTDREIYETKQLIMMEDLVIINQCEQCCLKYKIWH